MPFNIYIDGEYVEIKHSLESWEAFNYYYEIWDDWNQFNILPEGKGTNQEFPWYKDFIKLFNNVYEDIKSFYKKKARR